MSLIFLCFALWALLIFACLASHWSGRVARRRLGRQENAPSWEIVPTSVLSLLGLILAFTLSMAIARFDARKSLMVKESNAIGTAYLRAGLFSQPAARRAQEILREYAALRPQLFTSAASQEASETFQTHSESLHRELWEQVNKITLANQSVIAAQLITAVNEVIDVHSERIFASRDRVPDSVIEITLLLAMLGLGLLSYSFGRREMSVWPLLLMAFLFTVTIVLIVDLDRPTQGSVAIDQQILLRLGLSLKDQ